jgi:cytochrome c-type biogenesis protein CcmE
MYFCYYPRKSLRRRIILQNHEQVYLVDHYEEVDVAEAVKKPIDTKIWVTGLVVSISGLTIVLADPTGELNVYMGDIKPDDLQQERVIRVLGRLRTENHVEAEWILPLNIQMREFMEMRQLEKKKKKS